jgi:glycosyltransferase involved in cell wall biosynthesis
MSELVSIITPVYNGEKTIVESIQSVIGQTYTNWELIIVNDGSTDDTLKIANQFYSHKIKIIDSDNFGVSSARNLGITNSSGKYIVPLDADNTLDKDFLSLCLKEFERNSNLKLVYTEANLFGGLTGLWNLPDYNYKTLLHYNMIDNCAVYLREDFNRVGGYRLNMVEGLEDWDFWIALLSIYTEDQVKKITTPLFNYRVSNSSRRSTLIETKKFDSMLQNIVYNNFEIYNAHYSDIHNRIICYDYNNTMMRKWPVRLIISLLNTMNKIKKMLLK